MQHANAPIGPTHGWRQRRKRDGGSSPRQSSRLALAFLMADRDRYHNNHVEDLVMRGATLLSPTPHGQPARHCLHHDENTFSRAVSIRFNRTRRPTSLRSLSRMRLVCFLHRHTVPLSLQSHGRPRRATYSVQSGGTCTHSHTPYSYLRGP